jgi:hypothetical protein
MSIIITAGIIVLMFAWVPILYLICPREWRQDEKASPEKKQRETPQRTASVSSLSSKRLAGQSGDFLHALSTRGGREIPRSHASGSRVSPGSCAE